MARYNEIGGKYLTKSDVERAIESWEDELADCESEIEDLEDADYDEKENEIEELKSQIEDTELVLSSIDDDSQLILDDEFENYARVVAEEQHGIDTSAWPFTCIDWSQAANDLQSDYTVVEISVYTYYMAP